MKTFDFRSLQRIPKIDVDRLPFRAEVRNFRHYTFWVDFSNRSQCDALQAFWTCMIQVDRRAQHAFRDYFLKTGVMPQMREFESKRYREGAFPPDYVDLFCLYAHVRANRPKRILEYGSGISTLVMAVALEQNGEGRLVSIEPSEEWAASTRAALPARLLERAEVMYSSGKPLEIDGGTTVCFADQPVRDPDMIYIDGAPEGARYAGAENIVLLEKSFAGSRTTIYIDSRREAIDLLRAPQRSDRYEITSYLADVFDVRTERRLHISFGLDQFSNTMVRWRG